AGDKRGVVVEAEVAAAFVVVESELALELAVVELDLPAQAGEPGEPLAALVLAEVGEPVIDWRVLALGPFDDQPLPARRLMILADGVGGDDADEREPARHFFAGRCRAAGQRLPGLGGQARGEHLPRLMPAISTDNGLRATGR